MLEIYRTLKLLGFEWKAKTPERAFDMTSYGPLEGVLNGNGHQRVHHSYDEPVNPNEDPKKRKRREEEEFNKKAQALFFIETRCKLDDVVVRMDLQLYTIDAENYLVDFRNLGYKRTRPPQMQNHPRNSMKQSTGVAFADSSDPVTSEGGHSPPASHPLTHSADSSEGGTPARSLPDANFALPPIGIPSGVSTAGTATPIAQLPGQASSVTSRQLWEAAAKARIAAGAPPGAVAQSMPAALRALSSRRGSIKGATPARRNASSGAHGGSISSPFLFLECACRLIVELGECTSPQNLQIT